jgi:hypothetical protein
MVAATRGRPPVRLIRNDDGCEFIVAFFQQPGQTDEVFAFRVEWARNDYMTLKAVVEALGVFGEGRENPHPGADAFVEAREVILLVGRVDTVFVVGEADQ